MSAPLFWAKSENPIMTAAFQKAQSNFKYFWRELYWEYRRIIPALSTACVKVVFTQEAAGNQAATVEHMWINNINFDGNNISGELVNSPNELTNVALGDKVSVPIAQISDWFFALYYPKPKSFFSFLSAEPMPTMHGGFTLQAMRSEMSNAERRKHDKVWGIDFGKDYEVLLAYDQKLHPENLIEHPMCRNSKESYQDYLKNNPDTINEQDEEGYTLLHNESIAGNICFVELLLSYGADKNIKTKLGQTPMDFAQKLNWQPIVDLL